MTIFTVPITGVSPDPEVYGGLTAAASYIGSMFGSAGAAWLALVPNAQAQTLVAARRYLDQQTWDGARTGLVGADPTTLAWPRSGITLGDGTPVDATTVPPEVVDASFELAVIIAGDETVTSKRDQGSNISSVGAGGGVSVSFFSPTSARLGTASVMPEVVQRLVGRFLASGSGSDSSSAGVGLPCSSFSEQRGFRIGNL